MGGGGGGGGEKITYNGRYPYLCSKFDPPLKHNNMPNRCVAVGCQSGYTEK